MLAADFRTRQALADLERAAGGDPLAEDTRAAFVSAAPPERLWSATACLLWQALANGTRDPFLADLWDQRHAELVAAPAPIRAALMNGFARLRDLGLVNDRCRPRPEELVTQPLSRLEPALMTIARAMTVDEIDHISRADYGMDAARHRAAIVALLADPNVAYPPGEYWYPAEVVELVAHVPTSPGYIPCMAIVLLDALRTGDAQSNAEFRLQNQWAQLVALPQGDRDAVFAAHRHLYETDPHWSPDLPADFTLPWT